MNHSFNDFHPVFTALYAPNTVFGFFKTANSFHGVELFPDGNLERNLILFLSDIDKIVLVEEYDGGGEFDRGYEGAMSGVETD